MKKRCSCCGEEKDLSEFKERKLNKDGYDCVCNICKSVKRREYRKRNFEIIKIKNKEYRDTHREQSREYNRKRYEKTHFKKRFRRSARYKETLANAPVRYKEIMESVAMGKQICGIYVIMSLVHPERVYIGSSINIDRRIKSHKCELLRGVHHNPRLQNHFNKYGKNDFIFGILEFCDVSVLLDVEQNYLDLYKPFFNIDKNVYCSIGKKMTRKTRHKLKMANIGKKATEETKHKMSIARKGRPKSEEHKRKIGEKNAGRKHTQKSKRKLSQSKIGKKLNISEEERQRRRDHMNKIRKHRWT